MSALRSFPISMFPAILIFCPNVAIVNSWLETTHTYMIYSQYKMQLYTQDLYDYHIIIGIVLLLPSIMNLIFELCRCKYYSNSLHFLGFCKVLSANKKAVVVAEYSIFFSNKFIQIANNHLNIFGRYM